MKNRSRPPSTHSSPPELISKWSVEVEIPLSTVDGAWDMTTQIRVTYFCPNCSEHCFLSKTVNYPDFFGSGGGRSSSASVRPSPSAPFRFLAFLRVCSSLLPLSSGLSGVRCIGFLFFSIISFELLSLRQVSRVSERQEAVATRPEGSCNAAERSSEGSNCAGSKSLACLSKKIV